MARSPGPLDNIHCNASSSFTGCHFDGKERQGEDKDKDKDKPQEDAEPPLWQTWQGVLQDVGAQQTPTSERDSENDDDDKEEEKE